MSKNIIIFSDGTGQEGGKKYNTNVYKIFNMIRDRSTEQIAYYDQGLGTGWNKISGNLIGSGITQNIMQSYHFIFDTYQVGDELFLFGFSRGAATVRSLAGFIHLFGILPKSRPELIKQALTIYKMKDIAKRQKKALELLSKNKNIWCKIKFIGVWDTVAALGLPIKFLDNILTMLPFLKHQFHDFTLSESICHAYQALSIDDKRKIFHPILWKKNPSSEQTLKQVWFCGSHTDVGGGYKSSGLSDIPLVWMLDQAMSHGLKLFGNYNVKIDQQVNAAMHDETSEFPSNLFRRQERIWDGAVSNNPTVHASVLARTLNIKNQITPKYAPWILQNKYEIEPWNRSNPIVLSKPRIIS